MMTTDVEGTNRTQQVVSSPEVHGDNEKAEFKRPWVITALIVAAAMIIGLGVGLGVRRHRAHLSRYGIPTDRVSSHLTTTAYRHRSTFSTIHL